MAMSTQQPVRILVAGCAYAGIAAVLNLLDLCHGRPGRGLRGGSVLPVVVPVTVCIIDERDGFFHLIGTPLAFASKEYAPKPWIRFEDIPALHHPDIQWRIGSLERIDPNERVATIHNSRTNEQEELRYDYFVAATGLRRAWPAVPVSLDRDAFIAEAALHVDKIRSSRGGIVVIGGGAVGVETAAELKYTHPSTNVTLIHSRDRLLSAEPFPDEYKLTVFEACRDLGIEVVLNTRVLDVTRAQDGSAYDLKLEDGPGITADQVMPATTKSLPTTSYLPKSALDGEGFVKINSRLRYIDEGNDPYHLAAGDLVAWSGVKRCGRALSMGARAAQNIYQHILASLHDLPQDYSDLQPIAPVIALALGNKAAVYDSKGTRCSEQQMVHFFGEDLSFQRTWDDLKLGERHDL